MIIKLLFAGLFAGTIVASWQGFKDSPWEGFELSKFLRSPIIGVSVSSIMFFIPANMDNLGVLILSVICFERLIGEIFKGFLRPKEHEEYIQLLSRLNISHERYVIKLICGFVVFICVAELLYFYIHLPYIIYNITTNKILLGAISGFIGGITVAIGGAIKDTLSEGFKYKSFIISPVIGFFSGLVVVNFVTTFEMLIIASIGFERIINEFYKTFYFRRNRGIFSNKTPSHPEWFRKRWVFFVSYSTTVIITLVCAILNI
jgi:hypothetical protein